MSTTPTPKLIIIKILKHLNDHYNETGLNNYFNDFILNLSKVSKEFRDDILLKVVDHSLGIDTQEKYSEYLKYSKYKDGLKTKLFLNTYKVFIDELKDFTSMDLQLNYSAPDFTLSPKLESVAVLDIPKDQQSFDSILNDNQMVSLRNIKSFSIHVMDTPSKLLVRDEDYEYEEMSVDYMFSRIPLMTKLKILAIDVNIENPNRYIPSILESIKSLEELAIPLDYTYGNGVESYYKNIKVLELISSYSSLRKLTINFTDLDHIGWILNNIKGIETLNIQYLVSTVPAVNPNLTINNDTLKEYSFLDAHKHSDYLLPLWQTASSLSKIWYHDSGVISLKELLQKHPNSTELRYYPNSPTQLLEGLQSGYSNLKSLTFGSYSETRSDMIRILSPFTHITELISKGRVIFDDLIYLIEQCQFTSLTCDQVSECNYEKLYSSLASNTTLKSFSLTKVYRIENVPREVFVTGFFNLIKQNTKLSTIKIQTKLDEIQPEDVVKFSQLLSNHYYHLFSIDFFISSNPFKNLLTKYMIGEK
ncbi:hypothetical protein DLAC_02998 [Tieghemostelium lacteum]|uniref:Uncharacterized protein n=1 Tax=Tieghemostelium lacteum TaxID=361077 RepID=A0A152A4D6_TIELA|nr:hypothetical protein DLAC_02998 [Tieghemostelium lacteum]|eukprot:KYR00935.1 hypothetical protein DLAC_02998 [Tieghemostelium lacteum]